MVSKGKSEKSKLVGFRAHPEFATLIQTVYECGHAYSSQLARFTAPTTTEIRCAKCVTGMPADLRGRGFREVCNLKLVDHPLIGKLAKALLFHMNFTEKRLYMRGQTDPAVEDAIKEARDVLEAVGVGFDPIDASREQVIAGNASRAGAANERSVGFYYELPDLSLV